MKVIKEQAIKLWEEAAETWRKAAESLDNRYDHDLIEQYNHDRNAALEILRAIRIDGDMKKAQWWVDQFDTLTREMIHPAALAYVNNEDCPEHEFKPVTLIGEQVRQCIFCGELRAAGMQPFRPKKAFRRTEAKVKGRYVCACPHADVLKLRLKGTRRVLSVTWDKLYLHLAQMEADAKKSKRRRPVRRGRV